MPLKNYCQQGQGMLKAGYARQGKIYHRGMPEGEMMASNWSKRDQKEQERLIRRIKAILEANVLDLDELDIYGQILNKTGNSIKLFLESKK